MRNPELAALYAEAARYRSLAAGEADAIGDTERANEHRAHAETNRYRAAYARPNA